MIIVYGNRWYGSAFERQGAGVATRCFHIYYVPLVPHAQMWVTDRRGGRLFGFQTRWSWRAAMVQVALPWGVAAAGIAGAAIAPIATLPVLGGAIALWLWGHASGRPKDDRDLRRRELTARVLKTGCPTELLPEHVARAIAADLDEAWGQASPDRSPEDVAQLGPRDQQEAALAYTLFAVRARLEPGELGAKLAARAEQVLDAIEKAPALPEGAPYRAELKLPETSA